MEDGAHGRGPPLRAAMGSRRLAGVAIPSDLAQALAFRMLCLNVKFEPVGDGGGSPRRRGLGAPPSGPASLLHEPLELVDRNEPRPPGHVHGLEQRQHPPTEGRSTHPERLGSLRPRVGESLDLRRVANDRLRPSSTAWAEIGRLVGQRKLSITADTYTHMLTDGRELDYRPLVSELVRR